MRAALQFHASSNGPVAGFHAAYRLCLRHPCQCPDLELPQPSSHRYFFGPGPREAVVLDRPGLLPEPQLKLCRDVLVVAAAAADAIMWPSPVLWSIPKHLHFGRKGALASSVQSMVVEPKFGRTQCSPLPRKLYMSSLQCVTPWQLLLLLTCGSR